jgi:hypothetical protein
MKDIQMPPYTSVSPEVPTNYGYVSHVIRFPAVANTLEGRVEIMSDISGTNNRSINPEVNLSQERE